MAYQSTESAATATLGGRGVLRFVLLTAVFFGAVTSLLLYIDFVPEPPHTDASVLPAAVPQAGNGTTTPAVESKEPERIVIDAISLDVTIKNPQSSDIEILDAALLEGAVRYPGSASLGETGNMLLFGHSSYLPVVHNSAYKAFNGIQKLTEGNVIRVQSATHEYVYRVTSVRQEKAADAQVVFESERPMLTLATCDTFGEKSDRWVVEAEFVGSYPRSI